MLSDIIQPVGVGAFDDPLTPQIQLTEIGKITEKYLLSSENIPGVKIDRYVVMPDHIHVIIFLYPDEYASHKDGSSRAPTPTNEMLPHIVSTFKRFCNYNTTGAYFITICTDQRWQILSRIVGTGVLDCPQQELMR